MVLIKVLDLVIHQAIELHYCFWVRSQLTHDIHFKSNNCFICLISTFLDFKKVHNLQGALGIWGLLNKRKKVGKVTQSQAINDMTWFILSFFSTHCPTSEECLELQRGWCKATISLSATIPFGCEFRPRSVEDLGSKFPSQLLIMLTVALARCQMWTNWKVEDWNCYHQVNDMSPLNRHGNPVDFSWKCKWLFDQRCKQVVAHDANSSQGAAQNLLHSWNRMLQRIRFAN